MTCLRMRGKFFPCRKCERGEVLLSTGLKGDALPIRFIAVSYTVVTSRGKHLAGVLLAAVVRTPLQRNVQCMFRCGICRQRKTAVPGVGCGGVCAECAVSAICLGAHSLSGACSMRSMNWSSLGVMMICVRRLRRRPVSLSLDTSGLYSPLPPAVRRLGSTP